jgi:hypothetical protein
MQQVISILVKDKRLKQTTRDLWRSGGVETGARPFGKADAQGDLRTR